MHGGAAGSGAPKGERNGNWRHGRFTCEAIAERQGARGLLRSAHNMLAVIARHADAQIESGEAPFYVLWTGSPKKNACAHGGPEEGKID
jgi:hypothetical protein